MEIFPEPLPLLLLIGVTVEVLEGADRFFKGEVFAKPAMIGLEISSSVSGGSITS